MKPTMGVFIRFCFDKAISEQKMGLFGRMLECLRGQVYKDFRLYIITEGMHDLPGEPSEWEGRRFDGCPENTKIITEMIAGLNAECITAKEALTKRHNIQIRVDADDIISSFYTLKCLAAYHDTDRDSFIICFQPYGEYFGKGEFCFTRRGLYHPLRTSMFLAYCQKGELKHNVFSVNGVGNHLLMGKTVGYVVMVDEGYCVLSMHGENDCTKPRKTDEVFANE